MHDVLNKMKMELSDRLPGKVFMQFCSSSSGSAKISRKTNYVIHWFIFCGNLVGRSLQCKYFISFSQRIFSKKIILCPLLFRERGELALNSLREARGDIARLEGERIRLLREVSCPSQREGFKHSHKGERGRCPSRGREDPSPQRGKLSQPERGL